MRERTKPQEPRKDAGIITVGLMIAGAAAVFAGAVLYTGPLLPGRDFQLIDLAANRQNDGTPLGASEELADSITTGSINEPPVIDQPSLVPGWFREPGRAVRYRLRTAGETSALVDVSSRSDKFIYRVERGGLLPGLGRVRSIGRENGRWLILTERTRISSAGAELVGEQNAGEGTEPRQ